MKWFEQTKEMSSFGYGTAQWMFYIRLCRNHLCWTFAAMILWKTQLWDTFARLHTAEWIVSSNHDVSWEDDYCVMFFKLKFFFAHITSHVLFAKSVKHLRRKVLGKLEKYTFLWFKKETFISYFKWILLKDLLSSSLVDIIFLCTFLL